MKAIRIVALLTLCALSINAQNRLTTADIINLTRAGFSPDVIVAKVKQAGGNFDTSAGSLQQLKKEGVSEAVIVAMIEAEQRPIATISTPLIVPALVTPIPPKPTTPATPATPATLMLKAGTPIEIELAYTVSSAELKEGDPVSFRVVHPVKIGDKLVIERGAQATARVTKAEGGKSWGRGGKLGWAMQDVAAIDGTRIPLRFSAGVEGNGAPGTVVTGIVLTSIVFWPAAPLWGFKHGKAATVPGGKRFEVFVDRDAEISGAIVQPQVSVPARTESYYTPAFSATKKADTPKATDKKKKEWWEMK